MQWEKEIEVLEKFKRVQERINTIVAIKPDIPIVDALTQAITALKDYAKVVAERDELRRRLDEYER